MKYITVSKTFHRKRVDEKTICIQLQYWMILKSNKNSINFTLTYIKKNLNNCNIFLIMLASIEKSMCGHKLPSVRFNVLCGVKKIRQRFNYYGLANVNSNRVKM